MLPSLWTASPRYIGQGLPLRLRQQHDRNADINAAIASGQAIGPEVLASGLAQDEAWAEEIRLIALHKRVCDGGILLNRSTGYGSTGAHMPKSPEHRAKIGLAHKGRPSPNKGKPAWNKGKPPSAEARAKMSVKAMGRKLSPEARAKISAAKQGKPRQAETRAKIAASVSAALTGKKRGSYSPEHRAALRAGWAARKERLAREALPLAA